jgi:hypothetical protein
MLSGRVLIEGRERLSVFFDLKDDFVEKPISRARWNAKNCERHGSIASYSRDADGVAVCAEVGWLLSTMTPYESQQAHT